MSTGQDPSAFEWKSLEIGNDNFEPFTFYYLENDNLEISVIESGIVRVTLFAVEFLNVDSFKLLKAAAVRGSIDIVEYLISDHAELPKDLQRNLRYSVLDQVFHGGHLSIIKFFEKNFPDIFDDLDWSVPPL